MLQIFNLIKKVKIKNLEVHHQKKKEDLYLIHIKTLNQKRLKIKKEDIHIQIY